MENNTNLIDRPVSDIIFHQLTPEQLEFVTDCNHSILVSASAGTGKTTTMVKKIIYLIVYKKIDLDQMLIVTYTTAAASKLRHDIYNMLTRLKEITESEELQKRLVRQMEILPNADIGTIHAFCNKLIKKYFYKIGVDPNYVILSNDKLTGCLLDEAMNNVFERVSSEGDLDFERLYESFNSSRSDDNLKGCIAKLYNYIACRRDSVARLQNSITEGYNIPSQSMQYVAQYYRDELLSTLRQLKECYEKAKIVNEEKIAAYAAQRIGLINEISGTNDCIKIAKAICNRELDAKPSWSKNKIDELGIKAILDGVSEVFKGIYDKAKKTLQWLIDDTYSEDNEINQTNASKMLEITMAVGSEYARLKRDRGLVDFGDLENYAANILGFVDVVEECRRDYAYVFVDEYQDVNPMQEEIISGVSGNNNLYMIGDIKQSIYRFRQSSPEIFLSKYNDYKSPHNDKKVVFFNKNFRSNPAVLGFVNDVFDKIITKKYVGIDYAQEARLVAGKSDDTNTKAIELCLIDSEAIELDDDTTKRSYEAELIASKVAQEINNGAKFSDIAVLLRDKQELAREVWLTLKKYNIPITIGLKANIWDSAEIKVLLALCQCIYNENNDIAFVTLLHSHIIDMTDEELSLIRLSDPDTESFYAACLSAKAKGLPVAKKILQLQEILRTLRLQLQDETIYSVMDKFLLKSGLFNYYRSMVDGAQKECYINEFLNIINNPMYERDMARLLDYIDSIKGKASEINISMGHDSVKVMTMHASKGLDYPIVIVGGFGEKVVKNKSNGLYLNKDLGIAVKSEDSENKTENININAKAITIRNYKEELEESIRLLYVALTRPKNKLIITGVADIGHIEKKDIIKADSYLDLYVLSLSSNEISGLQNNGNAKIVRDWGEYEIEIDNVIVTKKIRNNNIILDVANPVIVTSLQRYYNYTQPNYNKYALKNSVSSILREESADYDNALDNFKKLTTKESLNSSDAMELGTQYHAIMQNVDWKDIRPASAIIKDCAMRGIINPIYLPMIDALRIDQAIATIRGIITNGDKIVPEYNFLTYYPHNLLISGSDCDKKVLIQGVIDLCIIRGKEAIIVDYKTNKKTNPKYYIDTYRTQLELYAKSVELAYQTKVTKKYIYSFEMGQLIEIE